MAAIYFEAIGPARLELFPGMLDPARSGHRSVLPCMPLDRPSLGRHQHAPLFSPNRGPAASHTARHNFIVLEGGKLAFTEPGRFSSAHILGAGCTLMRHLGAPLVAWARSSRVLTSLRACRTELVY